MRVQRVVMPVTGAESWTVVDDEWALVEPVERYLAHLAGIERSPNTVRAYAHGLRLWFEFLGARPLPRFIPEFVMAQLEDPERLAMLPDATTRALVIVIMETGARATDACSLPFNPIIEDSVGWPCLRYFNTKMAAEQLVPLSAAAAEAIRAQQTHLLHRWPDAVPVLFPAPRSNPDATRPFSYATLRQRLARWQHDIDPRDDTGQPVRVTAHQFRHTFGTRLINMGVRYAPRASRYQSSDTPFTAPCSHTDAAQSTTRNQTRSQNHYTKPEDC